MSMIYLHPTILHRPATVTALEMVTGLRATWTGSRAVLVRPGHGTLCRCPMFRHKQRPARKAPEPPTGGAA